MRINVLGVGLVALLCFNLSNAQEVIGERSENVTSKQIIVKEEYTKDQIIDKINTYSKLRKTGTKLLTSGLITAGVGVTGFATGIVLLSNGEAAGIPPYLIGYAGILVGTPLSITGGILQRIGRNKSNEYQTRLDRISLDINAHSIKLAVTF